MSHVQRLPAMKQRMKRTETLQAEVKDPKTKEWLGKVQARIFFTMKLMHLTIQRVTLL